MRSLATVVAAGLLAALVLGPAGAQDEKTPTIKDVMDRLHKGAGSPLAMLGRQLKHTPPPWEDVQKTTKDFVTLGAALAKNEPPRGDKSSWERLAKSYHANAQAMDKAAQEQDLAGTKAARGRLGQSCKACHDAHKGD